MFSRSVGVRGRGRSVAAGTVGCGTPITLDAVPSDGNYYDEYGGYYDEYGGYYDPEGGYFDAEGGYFDNQGGYYHPDGSYTDAEGYVYPPTTPPHSSGRATSSRRPPSGEGFSPPIVAGALAAFLGIVLIVGLVNSGSEGKPAATTARGTATTVAGVTTTAPPSVTTTTLPSDGKTAAQRTLTKATTITAGGPRPKSVVYSGGEYFFAQNMMYAHTMTVYDRKFQLIKTISDTVNPSQFGFAQYNGEYKGAPVEAAFSPDGKYAYVSQYQMYGKGFDNPGSDNCPGTKKDDSFVYRVDTTKLVVDQLIKVGAVPKYVAVTPDGKYVLVSDWCGYDLSVIDRAKGVEIKRIPMGRFPRGIAVSADSSTAYVAVMGSTEIKVVNLRDFSTSVIASVGDGPRHLVISPDGKWLYATLNGDGKVAKIDLATRTVVARKATGKAPRSMAISNDGTALYVVNYSDDTMSKVATADMSVLQTLPTNHHPIGITYDPWARTVWVACYSGSIVVFQDR